MKPKEAERLLKENKDILSRVAEALLLVETIDGEQFEALFTGEVSAEGLAERVKLSEEEKKAKNAEEAAERERLLKEEEERMQKELEKYDGDYLNDDTENNSAGDISEEAPSDAGSYEKEDFSAEDSASERDETAEATEEVEDSDESNR